MISDQLLLEKIQTKDAKAFDVLFTRYEGMIRHRVCQMVRDRHAGEDLVQETFLRVWTRAEQWSGKGKVSSWLYQIATNLSLNYMRSRNRRPFKSFAELKKSSSRGLNSCVDDWMASEGSDTPGDILEKLEDRELLQRFIERLSDEKREILVMIQEDGVDQDMIAKALAIPKGTVKSRLHYAIRQIAREWQKIEPKKET